MYNKIDFYINNLSKIIYSVKRNVERNYLKDMEFISTDIMLWPNKEKEILLDYREKKLKILLEEPYSSYRYLLKYLNFIDNADISNEFLKKLENEVYRDYIFNYRKDYHDCIEEYLLNRYYEHEKELYKKTYHKYNDKYIDDINKFISKWNSIINSLIDIYYCVEKFKDQDLISSFEQNKINLNLDDEKTEHSNIRLFQQKKILKNYLPENEYQIVKALFLRIKLIDMNDNCINNQSGIINILYNVCYDNGVTTIKRKDFIEGAYNEFGIPLKRNNLSDYEKKYKSYLSELKSIKLQLGVNMPA